MFIVHIICPSKNCDHSIEKTLPRYTAGTVVKQFRQAVLLCLGIELLDLGIYLQGDEQPKKNLKPLMPHPSIYKHLHEAVSCNHLELPCSTLWCSLRPVQCCIISHNSKIFGLSAGFCPCQGDSCSGAAKSCTPDAYQCLDIDRHATSKTNPFHSHDKFSIQRMLRMEETAGGMQWISFLGQIHGIVIPIGGCDYTPLTSGIHT